MATRSPASVGRYDGDRDIDRSPRCPPEGLELPLPAAGQPSSHRSSPARPPPAGHRANFGCPRASRGETSPAGTDADRPARGCRADGRAAVVPPPARPGNAPPLLPPRLPPPAVPFPAGGDGVFDAAARRRPRRRDGPGQVDAGDLLDPPPDPRRRGPSGPRRLSEGAGVELGAGVRRLGPRDSGDRDRGGSAATSLAVGPVGCRREGRQLRERRPRPGARRRAEGLVRPRRPRRGAAHQELRQPDQPRHLRPVAAPQLGPHRHPGGELGRRHRRAV